LIVSLEEAIEKGSRKLLEKLAFTCESIEREKSQEKIVGGLHDYINKLFDEALRNYIREFLERNQEYKENDMLLYLATKKQYSIEQIKNILDVYERNALVEIAIAADEYDRETSTTPRVGGLVDYIDRLSNEEIKVAIISFARRFPELREEDYLKNIILRYKRVIDNRINGLLSILSSLNRKVLNKIALALEKYSRIKNNQILLGGLHDYINRLSDNQVIKIIQDFVDQHTELNDIALINQIAGNTSGELFEYLWIQPIEKLKRICLALEAYDRDIQNIFLLGGLHDYIDQISKDDMLEYVSKKIDQYPMLIIPGQLDKIYKQYEDHIHL
jgi:HD superfamily phosphohydrolase YqeK